MLAELRESGYEKLPDLVGMKQGYDSKVLHTVTHLLAGFFGVDTFSIIRRKTRTTSASVWLVETECKLLSGHQSSQLDLIRKFDVTPAKS